jgi:hypothetical protein
MKATYPRQNDGQRAGESLSLSAMRLSLSESKKRKADADNQDTAHQIGFGPYDHAADVTEQAWVRDVAYQELSMCPVIFG